MSKGLPKQPNAANLVLSRRKARLVVQSAARQEQRKQAEQSALLHLTYRQSPVKFVPQSTFI